ncbi:hypothetical protein GN244_ATG12992 [Phytophthora infestans]|uniref:Transmembrane protein n=1 Tax=Phytophthora infestans TaxID=4787 RepID=A0A833T7E3_PHYIN|nr:hypothetical protein GN244_ATG12992 [Phytophthora infestans]
MAGVNSGIQPLRYAAQILHDVHGKIRDAAAEKVSGDAPGAGNESGPDPGDTFRHLFHFCKAAAWGIYHHDRDLHHVHPTTRPVATYITIMAVTTTLALLLKKALAFLLLVTSNFGNGTVIGIARTLRLERGTFIRDLQTILTPTIATRALVRTASQSHIIIRRSRTRSRSTF